MPDDVAGALPPGVVISGLLGFIGTLFGIIAYFWRLHQAADVKREAEFEKRELERDRREAVLVAERDAWQHRWEASDARLGRLSNKFLEAFGRGAPE